MQQSHLLQVPPPFENEGQHAALLVGRADLLQVSVPLSQLQLGVLALREPCPSTTGCRAPLRLALPWRPDSGSGRCLVALQEVYSIVLPRDLSQIQFPTLCGIVTLA